MTLDRTPPASAGGDSSAAIDRLETTFGQLFDGYRDRLRQRAFDFDPAMQPAGYRTVFTLVVDGPMGATALAESLGFDKSVLSRQLHQLEELGFVSRAPDPSDGRAVIIQATDQAVERIRAGRTSDRDAFRSRLATWEQDDLAVLVRLLRKLNDA